MLRLSPQSLLDTVRPARRPPTYYSRVRGPGGARVISELNLGMPGEMSDQKREVLLRLASDANDQDAWRLLYDEFWPVVFARAYHLLGGDVHAARDISQEVFVRLAAYRPFGRININSFQYYLMTTCMRLATDLIRGLRAEERSNRERSVLLQHSKEEHSEEPLLEWLEFLATHLQPDEQRLFRLLVEGATTAETAEILEVSPSNARVLTHRLRGRLKALAQELTVFERHALVHH